MTSDLNYFLWLNLERTLDKRRVKMGVARRRQLKKSSLSEAMTKKVVRFSRKNRVTPISAAQGDTKPSDATGSTDYSLCSSLKTVISLVCRYILSIFQLTGIVVACAYSARLFSGRTTYCTLCCHRYPPRHNDTTSDNERTHCSFPSIRLSLIVTF